MGIEVLPPDVNESAADFAPAPGEREAIRYGLSAVRNVGDGVVQAILDARAGGGAFASFADFCRRVEPGVLTKRVFESLILAGAFDSLGYTRGGLVQRRSDGEQPAWERVAAPILAERKAEAAGQFSLFGGDDSGLSEIDESILEGPELDKRLLLSREKEMLGQFVTDHPLLAVRSSLRAQCSHDIAMLDELARRRARGLGVHARRAREAEAPARGGAGRGAGPDPLRVVRRGPPARARAVPRRPAWLARRRAPGAPGADRGSPRARRRRSRARRRPRRGACPALGARSGLVVAPQVVAA
jgi:DNA polymerase III alpha subunit